MNIIFGVDIGGTTVKIGKFTNNKLIEKEEIKTDTTNNGKNIIRDIINKIKEMTRDGKVLGIGMGVPGPAVNGIVYNANNLGWGIIDIKEEIRNEYPNIIVEILNDANAAALGEAKETFKGKYQNVVFTTLGTGIGAGIIINGKIYNGFNGSAGEVGHIKVEEGNKRKCTCGLYDCVECYASATGIEKTTLLFREGKETKLNKDNLTCKDVFEFAKQNDKIALEVVDYSINKLAIALAAVCNTINPEALIIGGGVSKAGEYLINKLKDKFQEYAFHTIKETTICLAEIGNDAGMWGCFHQVKDKLC